MVSNRLIFVSCLLAASGASAAEPQACQNSLDTRLDEELQVPAEDGEIGGPIELSAGEFEAKFGAAPYATMSGGVLLRQGERLAGAENASLDPERRAVYLSGDVRYHDTGTQVRSDSAEVSYDTGRIQFTGAEFSLGSNNSRGAADNVLINDRGELQLGDVSYTTCPPGSDDWELEADDIKLDTREGVGTAHNIKLRFQGVPILYSPYLSFPIGDARKSGILTPEFGSAGRSGNEIRVPFYWNIAPNYDATITPRRLSDRGLQLQSKFRYLTEKSDGVVDAQYLGDDDIVDRKRQLVSLQHRTLFGRMWRNQIDYTEVSDDQYFEDLGGSLSAASQTHLNRSIRFDWYSDTISFFGQVQEYQTLDDAILAVDEPYRRLPQVLFRGYWPDKVLGLAVGFESEFVDFDRDVGVTGWRANLVPIVELPIEGTGWFVNSAVAWDHTRYELSDTQPGAESDPTRTLPISSIDAGLVLERSLNGSTSGRRIQTLEPRMLYVHIPFRDQDALPVFDTITPDLNLVQLFKKNRFLGVDRIGDTDQVSLGVTSRILDVASGKELVTATIGQTRYLSDRQVTLPGVSPTDLETSDYIAEVRFLLYENLNFDFGHQWGTGDSGTTRSEARLQYRPSMNKILNLAYRFRRDSLEQGDLSWSWPIGTQWNFVGRYNFSFRDHETLEQFFGLEYESCCWGLRLISRRHISTRDGTRDSSFGLQLVLKGMSSIGTAADKLLERGILGYSATLR